MGGVQEKAILDNPEDRTTYSAYGDLLLENGDPRGEFVQVQLALEEEGRKPAERKKFQEREKQLLEKHAAGWVGDWTKRVGDSGPDDGQVPLPSPQPFRFERGILTDMSIGRLSLPCALALLGAHQTRLVRRLSIGQFGYPGEEDDEEEQEETPSPVKIPEDEEYPAQFVLLRWPYLENLRVFQLGWGSDEDYTDFCGFRCTTPGEHAHDFAKQMPRLEELYLFAHRVNGKKLFTMPMPNLRILQVYHSYDYAFDKLAANASLGKLTHLLCHPHGLEPGEQPYIRLAGLRALVRSPHLKSLAQLRLRLADFGDKGCEEIVQSGILKRLKTLDLRHGRIGDEGARILAACPDVRNLASLDLAHNELTPAGIEALSATGVQLASHYQHGSTEGGDIQYMEFLWQGDPE
jgi:uncharacterized protein (TIGR02996 family)